MQRRAFKHLLTDQSGSILLLVGLSLMVLFAVAGSGYDLGRRSLVSQKLQQSSDAAAVAGASMAQGTAATVRQATALRYFNMNFPATYLGVTRPAPTILAGTNDISVVAAASLPSSFIGGINITTLNSSGSSDVQYRQDYNKIDLILTMDNSGSMAMTDIGASSWLGTTLLIAQPLCHAEFTSAADIAYYGATAANYYATNLCSNASSIGITTASRVNALRYAANTLATRLLNPNPDENQIATVRWDNLLVGYTNFSQDFNTVHNDLLKMYAGGATISELGMAQAQTMGAAGFRSGAAHAVVLLTDGGNNNPPSDNAQTITICNAMKAQGVTVFTIGLGPDPAGNATIKHFLSDCATGPNGSTYPNLNHYFFVAPNATSLNAAFDAITGTLQAVRILN